MSRIFKSSLWTAAFVLLGALVVQRSASAATCAISTNTPIDSAYIESNSCDAITLTGTPTITWSGTIDTGRPVAVSINSGTITFSGALVLGNAGSSVTVASGATVTHAASDVTGVQITAPTVTVTGSIDVSSKGCVGGTVSPVATAHGPNLTTGVCTVSTSGYGKNNFGGAAHGGAGGANSGWPGTAQSTTYGTSTLPTFLGAGGGRGNEAYGGYGGGRVHLVAAGVLTVDGSIRASGGAGQSYGNGGGGGAGGSIYINASTLAGSGSILAAGGNGVTQGAGGGGGRIAVYYGTLGSFSLGNILSAAGSGAGGGSAGTKGTTFILDRTTDDGVGNLRVTSGLDFIAGGDYARDTVTIDSQAVLYCGSPTSLEISGTAVQMSGVSFSCASALTQLTVSSTQPLRMSSSTISFTGSVSNALFIGGEGIYSTSTTLTLSSADLVTFGATSTWQNTSSTISVTKAGSRTVFQIPTSSTFTNFSFTGASSANTVDTGLVFPEGIALGLVGSSIYANVSSTFSSLTIDATSSINASGKGCIGGKISSGLAGYGPNLTTGVCTVSTSGYGKSNFGGAAHAGTGGGNSGWPGTAQSTTYGSSALPVFFGSGGGKGNEADGGNGGGRIQLIVTGNLTVDGSIRASGDAGQSYGNGGGGGAGGSIYINTTALAGSGSILASGGNGVAQGGGGGGGRVAMYYFGPTSFSLGNILSSAGSGAGGGSAGTAGTVYTIGYSAPDTSSVTSPLSGSYNVSRNPTLTSAAYGNSPGALTHLSSSWKVTSDSDGLTSVWSSTGDTVNKTSIQVNTVNGTFTGALAGQTMLAVSSTYYAFVRHTNSAGSSDWSAASTYTTPYAGTSSTQSLNFDDATPATVFDYDSNFIEINASGNGLARLMDLGGGLYGAGGLGGYSTYKQLSILNNVATTVTNAQVSTTVAYASGMQSDFDDIRFTTNDGITLLDYYRVSKTDGVSALFHIEVPTLPASDTTIIRMHYGNAGATSASSFLSTERKSYASDSGLRAEWLMDEGTGSSVADTSGNGNTGTYTYNGSGGWLGSDSQFSTGDATKYDGSGDKITTPVSITGLTDDFSLETWAYSDSNGSGWGWFFGESAGGLFLLGKTSGASSIHYNMDGLGSGNTAAGTFTAGTWHHVVFSHDKGASNATKIYIDGSLVATMNAPAWSPTTAGSLLLGQRSNGETFTGKLDSGRVYTRALSAAEVLAHYQNRHYFSTDPTVTFGAAQSALTFASSTISVSAGGSHPSALSVYRMEETLAAGSAGAVTYQLSMDGSTWKYWNGSAWATASDDAAYTNTSSTMNTYLPLFVSQVGSGDLYVRTLFTSNGSQPVGLDALTFYYTPTNVAPDPPTLLGQPSLVDGSTTSTATPTFSFTLNDVDGADTVKYQIQIDDSADFGSPIIDYTSVLAAQGVQSFQVGQAAGSGSYVPGQDAATLSNGSYYWQVKAIDENAAASSYEAANAGAIAFVVDATSRYLSFESVTGSGLESVTATSVRILLSAPHFENVSTTYSIIIASTTAEGVGTDYVLSTGEVMIPAGETSTTISLVIVDDNIDEPSEDIGIELYSPINALIGSNTSTLYTILDDDTAGITFTDTGTLAVTEGLATDTFQVVLTSAPTSTVQILFATTTNSVTLSTSTIDFTSSNWNVPVEITVTATDDAISEGTHLGTITPTVLTTAYGYPDLSPVIINATITDNDSVAVTVSSVTGSAVEGGATASYSLVLTSQPTSTVEIALSADAAAVTLDIPSLSFTTLNWNVPQTITVAALDDSIAESTFATSVTHVISSSGVLGYTSALAISSASVNVEDDDTAGITFTDTGTIAVTEGLATDTFQVVLTTSPTSTVQILFATTTNGVTLSTSTIDFTSSNWNVPVEVTVTATDDEISEGTHLGTITPTVLTTAYGYSGLSPAIISATVTDNDSAGVSLSKTSASITEGRATDSYTVVLTTAPTSTVEVLLTASNARLSLSASSLTFTTSDWSTPQTVTVSTVDDTLFQSDQTGTITHTASSTGIGYLPTLSISSVTVSIRDTDNPGGGASSAGGSGSGGGGSVQTVFSLVPVPPPVAIKPTETTPPVVIIVAPAQDATTPPPPAPAVLPGQQVVTILNPTDIKSLVQATNGSRDFASEAKSAKLLTQDAREFRVPLSDEQNLVLANFVTYGISERTRNLGSGERRALVRDALQTMKTGTVSPSDLERLARGMKPEYRNLSAEIAQLPRVRQTFQAIYGHLPNFKDPSEDLAWNALMYRIRFPRDLKEEAQGIQEFRKLFKKSPSDPFQWAAVRVLGYVK